MKIWIICGIKLHLQNSKKTLGVRQLDFKRKGSIQLPWSGDFLCVCVCTCKKEKERKHSEWLWSSIAWWQYLGTRGHSHKSVVKRSADGLTQNSLARVWLLVPEWDQLQVAHILLKHSLALDHTWIPWDVERKREEETVRYIQQYQTQLKNQHYKMILMWAHEQTCNSWEKT